MTVKLSLACSLLIALFVGSQALPSYYHLSSQLEQSLKDLQSTCKNDYKLEAILDSPLVQLVTITKKGQMNEIASKQKVFYLFGEHARELISPEAGLNIIETLCGTTASSVEGLDDILEKNAFQIVLNANPLGRMLVEQGNYCQRTNEHGVDLNRNWDDHWEAQVGGGNPDTNPGTQAFSEIESRKIRDALEKFMPHIFATIHSGTLGMYTPYAYSTEAASYNEPEMLSILNTLNGKYCNCDVGPAGAKVGYLCPGTCLDYAYDRLKVPYSYAFEIYSPTQSLPGTFHYTSLLQTGSKKEKKGFMKDQLLRGGMDSSFLQTAVKSLNMMTNDDCLPYFNPTKEADYRLVVDNWTKALLELTSHVSTHREGLSSASQ